MKIELLKRFISSIVLIMISFYVIYKDYYLFYFFLFIIFIFTLIEWHKMTFNKVYYLPGLIFLFFSFYSVHLIKINYHDNIFFILILLICISTDIGGFLFGKFFKGPKLTKISPNKTYSGVIGSFILPLIVIYIYLNTIEANTFFSMDFKFYIIFLISGISQIGDLIISYFKRLSKIKDTGKIIPGHGGILDRIDGMIFVFPILNLLNISL